MNTYEIEIINKHGERVKILVRAHSETEARLKLRAILHEDTFIKSAIEVNDATR